MSVAMSDAGWMSAMTSDVGMVPGAKKTGVVRSDAVLLVSPSQTFFSVRYQAGLDQCCRGRREGGKEGGRKEGGIDGEGTRERREGGREGGKRGMEGEKKGGTTAGFLHYKRDHGQL